MTCESRSKTSGGIDVDINTDVIQIWGEVNGLVRQARWVLQPFLDIFGVSSSHIYPFLGEFSS